MQWRGGEGAGLKSNKKWRGAILKVNSNKFSTDNAFEGRGKKNGGMPYKN